MPGSFNCHIHFRASPITCGAKLRLSVAAVRRGGGAAQGAASTLSALPMPYTTPNAIQPPNTCAGNGGRAGLDVLQQAAALAARRWAMPSPRRRSSAGLGAQRKHRYSPRAGRRGRRWLHPGGRPGSQTGRGRLRAGAGGAVCDGRSVRRQDDAAEAVHSRPAARRCYRRCLARALAAGVGHCSPVVAAAMMPRRSWWLGIQAADSSGMAAPTAEQSRRRAGRLAWAWSVWEVPRAGGLPGQLTGPCQALLPASYCSPVKQMADTTAACSGLARSSMSGAHKGLGGGRQVGSGRTARRGAQGRRRLRCRAALWPRAASQHGCPLRRTNAQLVPRVRPDHVFFREHHRHLARQVVGQPAQGSKLGGSGVCDMKRQPPVQRTMHASGAPAPVVTSSHPRRHTQPTHPRAT